MIKYIISLLTTDCTEPEPGGTEPGGPSPTQTVRTPKRCGSARNRTHTRLEPGRPKQLQQQRRRRQQQQAAAASRSRVACLPARCKPGWSRTYIVPNPARAD